MRGLRAVLIAPCQSSKTGPESPRSVLQPRGLQRCPLGLSPTLGSLWLLSLLSPGQPSRSPASHTHTHICILDLDKDWQILNSVLLKGNFLSWWCECCDRRHQSVSNVVWLSKMGKLPAANYLPPPPQLLSGMDFLCLGFFFLVVFLC